ncbi:transposase [Bradyrhizobium sp. WSM 1738]|nr:transposase [Bradyrhizobium hereditatis]
MQTTEEGLDRAGAGRRSHLGYEKGDRAGRGTGNSGNGMSSKTILTDDGEIEIAVPRDRAGSFEPQLIANGRGILPFSTIRF